MILPLGRLGTQPSLPTPSGSLTGVPANGYQIRTSVPVEPPLEARTNHLPRSMLQLKEPCPPHLTARVHDLERPMAQSVTLMVLMVMFREAGCPPSSRYLRLPSFVVDERLPSPAQPTDDLPRMGKPCRGVYGSLWLFFPSASLCAQPSSTRTDSCATINFVYTSSSYVAP